MAFVKKRFAGSLEVVHGGSPGGTVNVICGEPLSNGKNTL